MKVKSNSTVLYIVQHHPLFLLLLLFSVILYSIWCHSIDSSSTPYVAKTSSALSSISYVATTSSFIPFLVTIQTHPLFLILILILYYSLLLHHPLIPLLLLYNFILYSLCFYSTNSSSISPVVTTSYSNTYITTTFS